jgi:hypothetical protein
MLLRTLQIFLKSHKEVRVNLDEKLSDELWQATYPIARIYAKFVAPLILLLCIISMILKEIREDYSLRSLVPLLLIGCFSLFYWTELRRLGRKDSASIGGGVGINPGDSLAWGRLVVFMAIFLHAGLALAFVLGY